jgi:Amt family ammonium transporter
MGAVCCFAVSLKHRFRFDDALDVVGVHGVGGVAGAIFVALLGSDLVNPLVGGSRNGNGGFAGFLGIQALGVVVVAIFAFVATWILIKITQAITGVRTTPEQEAQGLDIALHGEVGYNL